MATQTALALTEIGKPLTKITLPIPESKKLGENEIIIKITATGPPLDQKFRDRNMFNIGARLPAVIGGDLVGTVVEKGPNVAFPIGAHVFSQSLFDLPLGGGLQEYTIINGLYTAIVPTTISDEEAALYPINAVTAAMALFSPPGFGLPFPGAPESVSFDYASQKVAIIGGGTNTGKLAIQFARLAGIGTIIAVASASSAALLKSIGATHVVARQDSDVEEQVRSIVGDELLYVYDTFSFGDFSLGVSFLSSTKKGTFIYNTTGQPDEAVLATKAGGVDLRHIQGFSHFVPQFGQMFWKQLPLWIASGQIIPLGYNVIDGLDSVKVNLALDEYKAGKGGIRYHVRMAQSS